MCWHAKLISRGETSIENGINNETRALWKRQGRQQVYTNPYDFGWIENWRKMLGIEQGSGRTFLSHVLWPSKHPPNGNGLTWKTVGYDLSEVQH